MIVCRSGLLCIYFKSISIFFALLLDNPDLQWCFTFNIIFIKGHCCRVAFFLCGELLNRVLSNLLHSREVSSQKIISWIYSEKHWMKYSYVKDISLKKCLSIRLPIELFPSDLIKSVLVEWSRALTGLMKSNNKY